MKGISRKYEERFYPETFNDFAARMDWAADGKGNRNPVIVLDGTVNYMPVYMDVAAGSSINVDLAGSYDPDGNDVEYTWWMQGDAGTFDGGVNVQMMDSISTIFIPEDAAGTEIHLICEARDNGEPSLVNYRRIVLTVN